LGSGNNNRDVAVGGQLAVSRNTLWESGVSYYRGAWDRSGERLFQMAGAHLHWAPGRFDVLAEFLHLDVRGDEGMRRAFGRDDWQTHGGFLTVSGPAGSAFGRPATAYARGEFYDSGASDGTGGHEVGRSAAGGVSVKVNEWVTWKGEYLWLDYRVPAVSARTLQLMGYALTSGLIITF
ncbi:MAG: hypothetical protein HYV15_00195, partial [Elusimicrobia bacterium]|nr:hypothetical protein [Elusimicrobiota bacterium]